MPTRRYGAHLNIANGIREFAVATPRDVAVVDGDRSLTYAALRMTVAGEDATVGEGTVEVALPVLPVLFPVPIAIK